MSYSFMSSCRGWTLHTAAAAVVLVLIPTVSPVFSSLSGPLSEYPASIPRPLFFLPALPPVVFASFSKWMMSKCVTVCPRCCR